MAQPAMNESAQEHLVEVHESSDVPTHSSSTYRRDIGSHLKPWLFDLFSLLFGLICLIVIIVLLRHYDNKPLPKWHDVTYNAILSILAQAIKAALTGPLAETIGQLKWHWFWNPSKPQSVTDFDTYDAASRGPRGAFEMLFKRRMWGISSLGALLTIMAIATEPFLQQIPAYPIRFRESNGTAKISSATFYSDVSAQLHGEGTESAASTFVLNPATKGAFWSGLYNSNSGSAIEPTCSTGNCTWTPYSTLGICSACASISHTLNRTMIPGPDNEQMQWTAPNGFSGASAFDLLVVQTDLSTIMFKQLQAYSIVDLFYMQFIAGATDLDFERPTASECMLYFCVRKYSAAVRSGTLEEQLISTFPNITTPVNIALSALHIPTHQDNCTATNTTGQCQQNPQVTNLHPKGPVYDPAEDPIEDQAQKAIPSSYNGNVSISPPSDTKTYKINIPTLIVAREWMQHKLSVSVARSVDGKSASDVAQLFMNTNPSPIMQRTARVLTTQIRNEGGEHAAGQTLVAESFVQVRWAWLILPVAVLVLTIIFLATTMILGLVRRMPTWRTSSIPTLLYSLDDDTAATIAKKGPSLEGLDNGAKRYSMAVSTQREMWRLEGVKSDPKPSTVEWRNFSIRRRQ